MNYVYYVGTILTEKYIIEKYCEIIGMSFEKLIRKDRTDNLVIYRHILIWILIHKTKITTYDIASKMKFKSHSSAIHSFNKITKYISIKHKHGKLAKELMNKILNS